MENNILTEQEFLKNYEPGDYERPSVTTDMLLFTICKKIENKRKLESQELKILLIKRNGHPYLNNWALPGGFIDIDEDLEDAAYRELKEETNISENVYLEQLYTFGKPNRDPRMRVISVAYFALTSNENINRTKSGDDTNDAKWFTISLNCIDIKEKTYILHLENKEDNIHIFYSIYNKNNKFECINLDIGEKLAFDHASEIYLAISRIRNKIFYTDIAFSLLPKKFTLGELQSVYETILNESFDKPNFRKKIIDLVEETNELSKKTSAHRPAKLYRKK